VAAGIHVNEPRGSKGDDVQHSEPRAKLRALLLGDKCALMATVFDPISARIAQEIGFEAGLMGGSLVSHAVLGAPDLIILTLTELAEQVLRASRVSNVPLLIDADHGYGNALSVMRTVAELDRAGAGAIMIEDTQLPRAFGTSAAQTLLSHEESLGKLRAAVAARGQSDLLILGRTGAASMTSVDDAIVRFKAFEVAGVDALFIPSVKSRDDLGRIAAAVSLPLIVGGASASVADPAYLARHKVRLWSGGHQAFAIAVKALYDAMAALHAGAPANQLPGMPPGNLLPRLLRSAEYESSTAAFLGAPATKST
jgi:carboxyvinyl-carboxyphosphonate phosphorylmutase